MRFRLIIILLLTHFGCYASEMEGKRIFFPGRSWYFWLFIGTGLYLIYKYYTSHHKKDFFKSPFMLGLTLTSSILFVTFLVSNLFLHNTHHQKLRNDFHLDKILNEDDMLHTSAEADFTNPEIHEKYITTHFLIPSSYLNNKGQQVNRDDYTIQNLYYDKLGFTDNNYVQMAYYGLGIYFYKQQSLWNSKQFFSKLKSQQPYVYYYKALIAIELEQPNEALQYLKNAIKQNDKYWDESYHKYVNILLKQNQNQELTKILYNPASAKFIPFEKTLELYLQQGDIVKYYLAILSNNLSGFKVTGLLAALLILAVWLSYISRIDVFEHEKVVPQIMTLFSGMLSVWLVFLFGDFTKFILGIHSDKLYLNDLLFYIIKVGLVEETVKILPVILIMIVAPKVISEAYDYILYASISALGFAFVENLIYFQQDLTDIILVRALTSVPGHMIDSSIVAYGFVLSRYRFKNFPVYLSFPVFLLFGAIVHGLYDFWASTHTLSLFVFHLLFSVSVWVIIINNCINNSPNFSYRMKFKSENLQLFMAVCLTTILALQYFVISWELGPTTANKSLNSTLILGGLFIVFYTDKLTNMDLVKGYWNSIKYKNIGDLRRNNKFNLRLFLIRLISGDIVPHSFVGTSIKLHSHLQNQELLACIPFPIGASIVDRVVVTCVSKADGSTYQDPYWFILHTTSPVNISHNLYKVFIFRFLDDAPSFGSSNNLSIYLFCFKEKDGAKLHHLSRKDFRALGKASITKQP